ncbi:MAG TPA: lipoxygenase family protein, partial [Thermosynechococcaceae cyanobacterium]
MGFRALLTKQQGQYRYDPSALDQAGPARLFPYAGSDGTLRHVLKRLRQSWVAQGQLSPPWTLLLQQVDKSIRSLDNTWVKVGTLLVDWQIFQSNWFNFNLPPDEQFDVAFVQRRRDLAKTLLATRKVAQAAGVEDDRPLMERTQAQRSRFYEMVEAQGRSRSVVSRIHEREEGLSDREFARQRLAGQNPVMLRRLQGDDRPWLQSWAAQPYRLADGTEVDLGQASDRLFVADYPLLQQITPSDLQPGRYVGSPIALFHRSASGLEPVLIQVEPGRVVTPNAATDDWMRAKLYTQTADVTYHELVTHLCETHLVMESFAIATPRQLPPNHPVYRLLKPHFQFLLAVNTRGNAVLLGPGGAIEQLMAPTRETSLGLINQAYRSRNFLDYALPTDLKRRGVEADAIPDYPYRDDALLLWEAIERYTRRYLSRYYPDDSAVQQDPYLQSWAAELGGSLDSSDRSEFAQATSWLPKFWSAEPNLEAGLPSYARVPGFPTSAGELSLQRLIDIATQIIFTSGPQHAAVNFGQFDYVGYTPNAPLALYARPDDRVPLEYLLPNPALDLGQMELTLTLSGIRFGRLGSPELIRFEDRVD